jgi:hypothetical protein
MGLATQQAEVLADAFQEAGFKTRVHTSRDTTWAMLFVFRPWDRAWAGHHHAQIKITSDSKIIVEDERPRGIVTWVLKHAGLDKVVTR